MTPVALLRRSVRRVRGAGHLGITGVNSLRLRLSSGPTPARPYRRRKGCSKSRERHGKNFQQTVPGKFFCLFREQNRCGMHRTLCTAQKDGAGRRPRPAEQEWGS